MGNETYESDDLNPEYVFNTVYTELLLKLATGEVNAQKLACKNMASRGLGRNGGWVDFEFLDAEGSLLETSAAVCHVRHYLNWTTSALGRALQVSSQTVKDWEEGRRKPGESALKSLKLIFIMQQYAEKESK
ncbi:MAG: hypothetical protein GWP07_06360 [Xanthomonadaceae bacterium]|nr:hypothetical protein [Xanthomonadaceae bacterium]